MRIYCLLALACFASTGCAQDFHPTSGVPNFKVPIHGHGKYAPSKFGKIYYETEGSGPVVILVAGGPGGDHTSFHPYFSMLAKDHTVVYFDNIGRGKSGRLKDLSKYTVPRDAEDIEALRIALGADKIDVIGHSYGGMPAMAYALKYPQHVSHLVLSDTLHSAEGFQENIDSVNHEVQLQYPDVWEQLVAMRKRGVKSGSDEYENLYGSAEMDIYWYDLAHEALLFRSGDPPGGFNPEIYIAMIGDDPEITVGGTMKGYDPRPKMKNLHVPVLICVGRYDRVAMPKVALEMKRCLPADSSKIVYFDKSGHRPWVEETAKYFATVGAFLNSK
jgi:proline iminopeptidase